LIADWINWQSAIGSNQQSNEAIRQSNEAISNPMKQSAICNLQSAMKKKPAARG